MEGTWKLNGITLGDSDTDVFVTATERAVDVHVPTEAVRGGTEVWERTGRSLRTITVTFAILNRGAGKFTWDAFIMATLEDGGPVLLESPEHDENYRILDTHRVVYVQPSGRITSRIVNAGQIDITFGAILLGAPRSAGGSYDVCSTYVVEFIDNDFWAATNSSGYTDAPLLGLPGQTANYPQARSPTTALMASLPSTARKHLIAAGDGTEALVQLWNLAGHVFGTPHAEGTGGPAHVCESPTGATGSFQYLGVSMLSNGFSLTAASAPWLLGVASGAAWDLEDGPAWTEGTAWSITAAGDGTTGAVTVQRITSADGPFIVEGA